MKDRVSSMIDLDLGCGSRKRKNYIGIDKTLLKGVDVVCDVEKGIPFKANVIDGIYSNYFLEHISDMIFIFQEMYRVCKDGATIELLVPYYTSINAFKDPTHRQFFTEETFKYFAKDKWYGSDYNINTNFRLLDITYSYSRLIRSWYPEFIKKIMRRYFINMASAMTVKLKVEK